VREVEGYSKERRPRESSVKRREQRKIWRKGEEKLIQWREERSEGAARKIDGVNREDGTSVIDAEVNRIGSLETLPIASHVDLPLSSHQGVVGVFAQAVHKRFITEACSCIRVDETKDGSFTRTSKTQTHTDCSRQCSETCVQVCEKEEKDMVPDKMRWSCKGNSRQSCLSQA
jgi:hypothetical protein